MIIFSIFFHSFLSLHVFPFPITLTFYFLDFLLFTMVFRRNFLPFFYSFSSLFLLFSLILNSPLSDAIISNPLHHSLPCPPPLFLYFFLFIYPDYFSPLLSYLILSYLLIFFLTSYFSTPLSPLLDLSSLPFPSTCNFIFLHNI